MEFAGERLQRKPITGIRGCWARAARGQVTAEPTTSLMKSRRRIAHPKARDYADFQSAITAGICDQRNGFRGLVCTAAIISPSRPLWVKKQTFAPQNGTSALPPKADIKQQKSI